MNNLNATKLTDAYDESATKYTDEVADLNRDYREGFYDGMYALYSDLLKVVDPEAK